jgi:hypothetical protein
VGTGWRLGKRRVTFGPGFEGAGSSRSGSEGRGVGCSVAETWVQVLVLCGYALVLAGTCVWVWWRNRLPRNRPRWVLKEELRPDVREAYDRGRMTDEQMVELLRAGGWDVKLKDGKIVVDGGTR